MWALAINPTSGSGKGAEVGRYVAEFLERAGESHQIISGASSSELIDQLSLFISRTTPCKGVIAVGGDGLFHNVIQKTVVAQLPLAVIPAGTGNDFVRTLGWPLNQLDEYLEVVISSQPQRVDLGVVDGEWFGAILSTGFDSVVNEKANSMQWPSGPMKYNVAIAVELPRFTPRHYKIELDDRTISAEAMLIAISNGQSYGGGMMVCPDADITDGLFDVMVLHPVSKIEFLKVFPRVFKGTHVTHPAVEIIRSTAVRISADAVAYADGERIGALPVSAQCIPEAMLTWKR